MDFSAGNRKHPEKYDYHAKLGHNVQNMPRGFILIKMQFRLCFSGFSDVTFMWIYWRFERILRASDLNISVVFHSIGKPKAPKYSRQVSY